jgi:hypothetical protein
MPWRRMNVKHWHRDGVKKKRERLAPAKAKSIRKKTTLLVKKLKETPT